MRDNATKRRSAVRSARRHAKRQRRMRAAALVIMFALKLRKRVRLARALMDLESLDDPLDDAASAKRGRASSPDESSSGSDASSSSSAPLPPGAPPAPSAALGGRKPRKLANPAKRAVSAGPPRLLGGGGWRPDPLMGQPVDDDCYDAPVHDDEMGW